MSYRHGIRYWRNSAACSSSRSQSRLLSRNSRFPLSSLRDGNDPCDIPKSSDPHSAGPAPGVIAHADDPYSPCSKAQRCISNLFPRHPVATSDANFSPACFHGLDMAENCFPRETFPGRYPRRRGRREGERERIGLCVSSFCTDPKIDTTAVSPRTP